MNARARPGTAYIPTDVEHVANMLTHALLIVPSSVALTWMVRLSETTLQYWSAVIYGIALYLYLIALFSTSTMLQLFIVPSSVALTWMVRLSETTLQYWSAVIYGIALIALFSTSTMFHIISYTGRLRSMKNVFHIGDRAVIYLFIAASYTPWLALRDVGDWTTKATCAVWTMAVAGIVYQYIFHEKFKALETFFYLIIGICPAIIILAMINTPDCPTVANSVRCVSATHCPKVDRVEYQDENHRKLRGYFPSSMTKTTSEYSGLHEVALGGCSYIIGVIFFKSDGLVPFAHAIWHCFVSLGAMCQFFAVTKYLYKCPILGSYSTNFT